MPDDSGASLRDAARYHDVRHQLDLNRASERIVNRFGQRPGGKPINMRYWVNRPTAYLSDRMKRRNNRDMSR